MTEVGDTIKVEDSAEPKTNGVHEKKDFQAPEARMVSYNRKASPADSEAETEILSGSQAPTPVKPSSNNSHHHHRHNGDAVVSPRKRKVSIDDSRSRSGRGSDSDDSDPEPVNRRRKNAKTAHDNYGSSTRSHSPPQSHPGLRSHHNRASSQPSNFPPVEPGRRLRRRRQNSEDNNEHESHGAHMPATKKGLDRSGRTQLARACNDGDFARVKQILDGSLEDLDRPDYAENSPLQMAACNGHFDICKLLVDKGAKINTVNVDGETPVKDAQDNEHQDIIDLLIDNGADTGLAGRKQGARERLLYSAITAPALLQYSRDGDNEAIDHCIQGGVKPEVEHAVAAAAGGHQEALGLLLAFGAPADPDPTAVVKEGESTPMLAAIVAGRVLIVRMLLNRDDFDAKRLVKGEHYSAFARSRRRRNWKEIANMLDEAIGATNEDDADDAMMVDDDSKADEEEAERKAKEEHEAAEKARIEAEEAEKAEKAEQARKARIAEEKAKAEEAARVEAEKQRLEAEKAEQARLEAERIETRRLYLASMPRVLSKALAAGSSFPLAGSALWQKSLQDWNYINAWTLRELDPTAADDRADELFIQGWQASMILGHSRLDEITAQVSRTLPMIADHRKMLFRDANLSQYLTEDAHWGFAPDEERSKCGLTVTTLGRPGAVAVQWAPAFKDSRQKFFDLPDDQALWVPFHDFNALVQKSERLKDFHYARILLADPYTTHMGFVGGHAVARAKEAYEKECSARQFQATASSPTAGDDAMEM